MNNMNASINYKKKRFLSQDSVIDLNSEAIFADENYIIKEYLFYFLSSIKISSYNLLLPNFQFYILLLIKLIDWVNRTIKYSMKYIDKELIFNKTTYNNGNKF